MNRFGFRATPLQNVDLGLAKASRTSFKVGRYRPLIITPSAKLLFRCLRAAATSSEPSVKVGFRVAALRVPAPRR